MSNFEKVGKFMKTFGQEVKANASYSSDKINKLRIDLIEEELEELKDAISKKDLKETIDALTDILYVTYGAGHAFGVNLDKCFEEVQNFKVVNSGLKTYFQNIFTAEKIGFKKPHPRIFLTAIESVNTSAYNSIMIGDSLEADIQGALDVGMQAIHFNTHNELEHNQCPIVYSMHELNQIFI